MSWNKNHLGSLSFVVVLLWVDKNGTSLFLSRTERNRKRKLNIRGYSVALTGVGDFWLMMRDDDDSNEDVRLTVNCKKQSHLQFCCSFIGLFTLSMYPRRVRVSCKCFFGCICAFVGRWARVYAYKPSTGPYRRSTWALQKNNSRSATKHGSEGYKSVR